MTFMPASSPCADTVPLVAAAATKQQPIITVFVNYRLNIFAFGDTKSSKNLALKDQRLAIEWVVKHIEQFGGDPVSSSCHHGVTTEADLYSIPDKHYSCWRKCWRSVHACPHCDRSTSTKSNLAVRIIAPLATSTGNAATRFMRQT